MAQKTVMNFAELKAPVEDAATDSIILGNDVAFSGGIKIPTTKKTLVIDGSGHTVTDNNSSSYADTLYVPAGAGATTVTMQNVVWSGRNYYGVICVYDDSANSGVTIILDNVSYKGPQMIYNRYGVTVVKDCNVSIEKNGASVSPQEFCEGNRLIFEGTVDIVCATTSSAVIWFPFSGSAFTVAKNAKLSITAPDTYMFYTDGAAKPAFSFKQYSSTRFNVKNGLFYAAGTGSHIAASCEISDNALLYARASANNGVPLFKCAGKFSVGNNASLFFMLPTKGTSPLIYFSTAAAFSLNSPKNVVLYSNGGKVFSFATGSASAPDVVSFSAQQINYWNTAKTPLEAAGGFDDAPTIKFAKADGTNVTVTQKTTSSAVLSTESNLVSGDTGYPADGATFDLTKAAVISAGELNLSINKITDLSSDVSGKTDAEASVAYADSLQTAATTAASDGTYTLPLSEKPVVGDTVTVKSNKSFLTKSATATVAGSVSVTFLPDIPFNAFVAPQRSAAVKRINDKWYLQLTDTRPTGGKWSLYVSQKSPLKTPDETIENAVVFSDGESTKTLGVTPLLVASGTTEKAGVINVEWTADTGVLLALDSLTEYRKGDYESELVWNAEFD